MHNVLSTIRMRVHSTSRYTMLVSLRP